MKPIAHIAVVLAVVLGVVTAGAAVGSPAAVASTTVTTTEFSAGISAAAGPDQIVAGPDGALWFTEGQASQIGRITTDGKVSEFSTGITAGAWVHGLAVGSDGNLWFTETNRPCVGRITPAGVVTEFSAGITNGGYAITAGPDGNLWFTEVTGHLIGKISTSGNVTEYPAGTNGQLLSITSGPDGNLWYVSELDDGIGRMTVAGVATFFTAGITAGAMPSRITAGPDGNLWFTEDAGRAARITTSGAITEFAAGIAPNSEPLGITTGPDGALWFTMFATDQIGRITTSGKVTEYSQGISAGAGPQEITLGSDGNLWFTESLGRRVAKAVVENVTNGGGGGGTPAPAPVSVQRLAGVDRIGTAIAVSQHEFATPGSAGGVVLARADSFPDALAGVPLAAKLSAPLLLTESDSLDGATLAEIERVLPSGATVTLLGGPAAISEAVGTTLNSSGYHVVRLEGRDRFDTATAVADSIGTPSAILLADGNSFADALSAGAAAAHIGAVLLLTDGTIEPPATSTYVSAHPGTPIYAIGGPAATADPAAAALAGADRYATSVVVAQRFFSGPPVVGLASGLSFADALAGGVELGRAGGPILLVSPTVLPDPVRTYLSSSPSVETINVYGGSAAISEDVVASAGSAR